MCLKNSLRYQKRLRIKIKVQISYETLRATPSRVSKKDFTSLSMIVLYHEPLAGFGWLQEALHSRL